MQKSEKEKLVAKLRRAADAQRRAYGGNLYHEGIAQGLDDAAGILGKVRCEEEPSAETGRAGRWIPQDWNEKNGTSTTLLYCLPKCSICGYSAIQTNFCPNCGARMGVNMEG